jgi:hypothetical protein
MALADRAMALARATATERLSHWNPIGHPFMGNGFSTGSTLQFDLPPQPPGTGLSSTTNPFGDTVFGTSGLTGPLGSNVFNMELPAPAQAPATMNTTEEMNAFNVLKSGMSGSNLISDTRDPRFQLMRLGTPPPNGTHTSPSVQRQ